jgi:hypothetical protein
MRSGVPPTSDPPSRTAAARPRPLTGAQKFLGAPLGLLWLAVLAIVAVPVLIYMTVLYYLAAGAKAVLPARRARNHNGSPGRSEERVA